MRKLSAICSNSAALCSSKVCWQDIRITKLAKKQSPALQIIFTGELFVLHLPRNIGTGDHIYKNLNGFVLHVDNL